MDPDNFSPQCPQCGNKTYMQMKGDNACRGCDHVFENYPRSIKIPPRGVVSEDHDDIEYIDATGYSINVRRVA